MAIDRIDWHSGGDYPEDLPHENGGTHIGFYLAWIINNNLYGEIHREDKDGLREIKKILKRKITGRDFLISQCDEKFCIGDLNKEGLEFTNFYYADENTAEFYDDYADTFEDEESIYHVENTWKNYDKFSKIIDKRYSEWKEGIK